MGPLFWVRKTAPGFSLFGTDGLSHCFWGTVAVAWGCRHKAVWVGAVYRAILAVLYFQHSVNARSKRNCNWGCLSIIHVTESEHIQMIGPIGTSVPCLQTVVGVWEVSLRHLCSCWEIQGGRNGKWILSFLENLWTLDGGWGEVQIARNHQTSDSSWKLEDKLISRLVAVSYPRGRGAGKAPFWGQARRPFPSLIIFLFVIWLSWQH